MGCHAACPKATVVAAHQTLIPRIRVKLHSGGHKHPVLIRLLAFLSLPKPLSFLDCHNS